MILKNNHLWYLNFILFLNISGYALPDAKPLIKSLVTVDDLQEALDNNQPTIIKTYSNGCVFCDMITKSFKDLASKYKKITFAEANGKALDAHKLISSKSNGKHTITGYPTFIFVHKGKIHSLHIGAREEELKDKVESFFREVF